MLGEIFYALIGATLPLAMLSYLLFHWSFKSGRLVRDGTLKEIRRETRRLRRVTRKSKEKGPNPIHNKWMRLGGGFYGVMGMWTYALVELQEVFEFFMNFTGILDMLSNISIGMIIGFFINSLTNFLLAIGWPIYWMERIGSDYIFVWFAAAYGGYLLGMYAARHPEKIAETVEKIRTGPGKDLGQ